ncbi:MAG TPA: sugar phosphate nucleotidyltransferase [Pyrinomonadaceae bacterium]|jgi:galactokinase/CTP:molybdopterin cytidylyltransferase MocA
MLASLFEGGARGLPTRAAGLLSLLRQTYGDDAGAAEKSLNRLGALCASFLGAYGDGPVRLLRAPARINILGEHVDYVSYLPTYSLPFGSREHDMLMMYRPSATGRVRGASRHGEFARFDFSLGEGPAAGGGEGFEAEWLSYVFKGETPSPHWGNYVKGSCFFARTKFGGRVARGFDFVVDSSIPPKGGASSSSALAVLAGAAIREVNGVAYEPGELAVDSSKAEWFVGTRGGSMDHLTICLARRSHAVRIAYREGTTRSVRLPPERLRWVTFFSHPADKGREIMLEYNERAAVSRLLIPAIIEGWKEIDPRSHAAWGRAVEALLSGAEGAADEAESLLRELPETVTLEEVERDYAGAYRDCVEAFPALVEGRRGRPLRVRAYALHHLGEVGRVSAAERLLNSPSELDGRQAVSGLGELLNETHASLRDLYGVSTPEVERLVRIILSDPGVRGARLMGGGFGGNVLALTTEENVPGLTRKVQAEFYATAGRDGEREGSVMISTPGDGLSGLGLESVWRGAVEEFNALGRAGAAYRRGVASMLDEVEADAAGGEVWPVIVAAGKGSRARESGLDVPKPAAPVAGVPAVLRVLRNVLEGCGGSARAPVVIVSPETERAVREALAGEEVSYAVQRVPLGTGDAVLQARELMKDFAGRALVVWGTQPVVRPRTFARALRLAALFGEYDMVLPTALRERPYAPVERDERGRVLASRETHLEGAPRPEFGETNNGLFLLKSRVMFDALGELRRRHWRESEGRYDRTGELGFPNEMINFLAGRAGGVLACPFADAREGQGIKTLEDVALCERFISELDGAEA